MFFRKSPIQRKLMTVMLLTSGAVLLLICSAYFAYEIISYRQGMVQQLSTLGKIVAGNSTAALAFDNAEDAFEVLSSVQAEPHIVAAALYDSDGKLFATFPENLPGSSFPGAYDGDGYAFRAGHLEGFQPVLQGSKKLGVLYLKSDLGALQEKLILYTAIAVPVILLSFALAYVLSRTLQRQISEPILALADTARAISNKHDYSVRAKKFSDDEVGLLTDAFNQMLARVQDQTRVISSSENRVRTIINSAMSAVIVIDDKGIITDWNARAEKMFGWNRSAAIGRELAGLIIPERYRDAHRKGLKEFSHTGEGKVLDQLIELSALRSDGTEFPAELSISAMNSGDTVSFCGFVTDITERKQAEEEIRSFNQRLEQKVAERTAELEAANHELESFSYSVSHDLRAPLRSVHGYMNIFSEEYADKLDDEGRRLISVIIRNSHMMGQLIDDLLAFSQLGRRDLTRHMISMQSIVSAIVDEQKSQERGREINVTLRDLPDAFADSVTIRQVWANLISNAIKYTSKEKKAVIEIGALENGSEVVYYIRDNGVGFNMEYYSKLFGVFQRLHSAQEFQGTGVGLAIVQRIVARHGGKVWAEAMPGEGATFYFSLSKLNGRAGS